MSGGWLEAPVLPGDPDDRWAVIRWKGRGPGAVSALAGGAKGKKILNLESLVGLSHLLDGQSRHTAHPHAHLPMSLAFEALPGPA